MSEPDIFQAKKRLYLLDSMALIYRAHYALIRSPRYTSGGLCTSAVFGMANTVFDLLNKQKPTHIAAVFDTAEPTHRHREFAEYKAQRDELPEDIAAQFPYVDRLFHALHIPVIRIPGFEADDIIGTLAREAEADGFHTWMVTPDKDYHQLVTDKSVIYKPGRQGSQFEILGVDEVLAQWEIERIEQVIDVLGLMGDTSDNIPGIPGIGPKTAKKLITKYGSIENLLSHTSELKGKQKEKIEDNADMARLSRRLVTIITDVPHDVSFDDLTLDEPDREALQALFEELEFQTLGRRIFGEDFAASKTPATVLREKRESEVQQSLFPEDPTDLATVADAKHDYHTVTTAAGRKSLLKTLLKQKSICFDTETTGLDARTATPLGISFAIKPTEAWYVVCPNDPDESRAIVHEFRDVFENESIEKIGHNLKYDMTLLRWNGVQVRGAIFDTMLCHSMAEPEMKHGMDYLAEVYLNYKPIATSELIGERGKHQKNMADVPLEAISEYACEDADITLRLSQKLRPIIEERGVAQVALEVECPLIAALVEMEYEGIRLDADALAEYSKHLEREIESLRAAIHAAAGEEFNIDSPKQLGVILYDKLRLVENPKKTATGQYSTRESELLKLAAGHQIVRDVLDYRNAAKLKAVYVDQLPMAVNPKTGRVHTHYSQTWTATGRMQSNDPNLQTIPVRKARGREIRAAFVARDDDHLLLAADYSQIELRIMAELSGDDAMMEAFLTDTDIHSVTASKVYGVEPGDVTREMRDKAKMVNFGIIYGISAFGLQQRLNIGRMEANDLIENYFETYPGVRTWIDRTIAFAEEHSYVKTLTGRRRYLRDINSRNRGLKSAAERLAMNSPIQGTAADMLKLAMIKIHNALREGGFETKMLLTVHDELVFDMLKTEETRVKPVIEECMTSALPMTVPIRVEMGTGTNWLEAH